MAMPGAWRDTAQTTAAYAAAIQEILHEADVENMSADGKAILKMLGVVATGFILMGAIMVTPEVVKEDEADAKKSDEGDILSIFGIEGNGDGPKSS